MQATVRHVTTLSTVHIDVQGANKHGARDKDSSTSPATTGTVVPRGKRCCTQGLDNVLIALNGVGFNDDDATANGT